MKRMNVAAYKYIYTISIQKTLAYRFDVFASIVFQSIVMFATSFFWKALYRGTQTVQQMQVEDMLTYTIISAVMSVFMSVNVENRVISSVRNGTVATDLLKPIRLYGVYFAEDIGNITSRIFQNVIPVLLIGSICITVPKPAGGKAFFLFLISFTVSFLINWLLSAIFSMWAFVVINMNPLVQVKRHLIRLLSGSVIPIWFFPDWLAGILKFLPFIYIYQLPLELYIGKGSMEEQLPKMGIQLFWLVVLWFLFLSLEKRVIRKVQVQGG